VSSANSILPNPAASCESRKQGSEFQFKDNYFAKMWSGSEEGSYLRFIDFVYHSTLGSRVTNKKKQVQDAVLSVSYFVFQVPDL
jgi:nucleoside-specific outer membrane channel protein Tsx